MNPSRLELFAGVFVLAGIAAVAWLAVKAGSGELSATDTYVVEARFTNASGLNRGGAVTVAGVPIGRVDDVRMDPSDYSAIATLRLRSTLRLPTDSMASIKTSGLIGDKFIALFPGAEDTYLEPGSRITMTESAVDLESLIGKIAFGSVDETGSEDEEEPITESAP